ncbi:inositol monophosphatase [Stappia sp. F7233]|uniref:Inositol-1-monophosphatase n=1 Tax=Stappia albiluteola TaxID=2758565 RepID=A0A839AAA0_9HYPH|nr:inositol monophosphatase family protein [Stappia albiluteola]MBA5776045.1 inositol monophosphatase [Stappia albiluteola]
MLTSEQEFLAIRRSAAEAIAREAGKLALTRFRNRSFSIEAKGTQDFVSEVDKETEALIRSRMSALFPEDGFIGEETGGSPARVAWVVDPIDGTANFVRGIGFWCVSIGLAVDGKPAVGVIYDPNLDELYSAASGQGATLNGAPMKVSGQTKPNEAIVSVGFSFRRPINTNVDVIYNLLSNHCVYRMQGAGALAMALVASGKLDGYVESHINSWDVLAGLVLVAEAGGYVNDFLANDGITKGNPILACSPALRDFLREQSGLDC